MASALSMVPRETATAIQVMWLKARQTTTLCANRRTRPATKLLWVRCVCMYSQGCIYKTVEGARRRLACRLKWWPCCSTSVKKDRVLTPDYLQPDKWKLVVLLSLSSLSTTQTVNTSIQYAWADGQRLLRSRELAMVVITP